MLPLRSVSGTWFKCGQDEVTATPFFESFPSQAPSFGGGSGGERTVQTWERGREDAGKSAGLRQSLGLTVVLETVTSMFPGDPTSEGPTCLSANSGWCVLG